MLAQHSDLDGSVLLRTVTDTFERRNTTDPQGLPIGLSDEFIKDAQMGKQVAGRTEIALQGHRDYVATFHSIQLSISSRAASMMSTSSASLQSEAATNMD